MRNLQRAFAALALGLTAMAAVAAATFQIDEIYSNADGAVQYVVLRETAGMNGQQAFSGGGLAVTHAGATKLFTFLTDLPSSATANRRVLIASQGLAALGIIVPDYVFPNQFLATDGATLDFSGVDLVSFGSLPTDGFNAIDRGGTPVPNLATNFAGQTATVPAAPVGVVEYYNASLDHYFISALQPDIDALDSGRITGWARTGQTFKAYPSQAAGDPGVSPVCRFYIPIQHGNSHFFSASAAECAEVLQKIINDPNYYGYIYETANAFYIDLPDTTSGACPPGTAAVFRLWNHRVDSNHRYTTDPAIKAQMEAMGYIAEGYGADAVSMCAPTGQPIDLATVNINAVAWVGSQFIAVAGTSASRGVLLNSTDGATWAARNAGTKVLRGVAWSGTQLVSVGSAGTAITSPDGLVWTAQSTGTTANLNQVAWCGTQFVAVGDGGAILTSPDGIAWTSRISHVTNDLFGAILSGIRIVVVGAGGTVLSSPTGASWTARTSGTANDLVSLVQTSAKLIAVGAAGTILQSADSGNTWAPASSGTMVALNGIAWSGTQLVTVGSGGRILSSGGGSVWTVQISGTGKVLNDIAWSGSGYAAVGAAGAILTSPDGVQWTIR